jgi:hypothetical protein
VAQPSPQRKALRVALRYVGLLAVAVVISFPISFIGTFMMNPVLNRLEARYGIELTGHSGPADWIFALVFGITTVVVFLALRVAAVLASGHHRADS